MLCVLILIHKWRDLQFKVDSERQIFWETFMAILFTLRVFTRNLLRGNRPKNTFRILFWCLAWGSNSGFSSNKPTHYLLDHVDLRVYKFEIDYRKKIQKKKQQIFDILKPLSWGYLIWICLGTHIILLTIISKNNWC